MEHPPARSLSAWWHSAGHGMRPLLQLSYAACSELRGGAAGFHLFNVLVHVANALLVVALAGAATARDRPWPFGPVGHGELAAGLLFALHPIQTEAVTYISGRSASLMAFFYLAALVVYVRGVRSRRALLWAAVAPALWLSAMVTKEVAVTFPLALLSWEACIERSRGRAIVVRQALYWALAGGALAAAIAHPRYFALLWDVTGERPLREAVEQQVHAAAYLVSRLLLLEPLSIDPGLGLRPVPSARAAVEGALLLAVAAAAWLTRRRSPAVSWGVLWWLLHVMIPYAILSRMDVMNERHSYLANAGLFVALGALWARCVVAAGRAASIQAVGWAVVLALGSATAVRNLDYGSALRLWTQTARASPANPRAHLNLGVAYESLARLEDARAAYRRALDLEPRYSSAREHLARLETGASSPSTSGR